MYDSKKSNYVNKNKTTKFESASNSFVDFYVLKTVINKIKSLLKFN